MPMTVLAFALDLAEDMGTIFTCRDLALGLFVRSKPISCTLLYMRIADILVSSAEYIGQFVTVQGWIVTSRDQKELTFLKINDGTHPAGLQIIIETIASNFLVGSSYCIEGYIQQSPAAGQDIELKATRIEVLGACGPEYPLTKSKMSLEYLRDLPHLRARTSTFGSVFRIKSAISQATHTFWAREGYLHLDPNIMTVNECEGGAGVFQVGLDGRAAVGATHCARYRR
jgi:asparaginyl-tRNA synthetase